MHPLAKMTLRFTSYLLLLTILIFLVHQRNQNTGYFNWRSKMWGDAAGYYIYSPALFIYGFDASKLPDKIVEKTGEGFVIKDNGKIITRYSCGVAILQSPIFLAVHLYTTLTNQKSDGFSGIYHMVSGYSAILYAFLGLLILWSFLRNYFNRSITFLSILSVFLGTNLLYYAIDATGMSHIYSFFLFALLLLLSKKFFSKKKKTTQNKYYILIAITIALIALIRPTNIVFVFLVFILDTKSWQEITERVKEVFTVKRIAIILFSFFIVFLPQMIYWKYSSGSFLTNSYEGYGFTNWTSPEIVKFLFSTNNGLFPYNPFYIVILSSLLFLIYTKHNNGIYILGLFLSLIYVYSSWFVVSFGCGFGSRNFVEYTTVFALSLGYFYRDFLKRSFFKWFVFIPVFVVLIFVNLKLTYSYNKCFTDGEWNWEEYIYLLKSKKYNQVFTYEPALVLNKNKESSQPLKIALDTVTDVNFRRAIVDVNAAIYAEESKAALVFEIHSPDSLLYWNGIELTEEIVKKDKSGRKIYKCDFWLPRHYTTNSEIWTYIWNMSLDSMEVSKIKIHLE